MYKLITAILLPQSLVSVSSVESLARKFSSQLQLLVSYLTFQTLTVGEALDIQTKIYHPTLQWIRKVSPLCSVPQKKIRSPGFYLSAAQSLSQ